MNPFTIRIATAIDIPQIQWVRNAVKENVLSDPSRVTDADCREFLEDRGKGWVAEVAGTIRGFAIADLKDDNIWALFVHPDSEGRGLGKALHAEMLNWYFDQGKDEVWLSTDPGTRAETFYRLQGWRETGIRSNGEIEFRMNHADWRQLKG